jgi:VCBS repeat-containing protein
MPLPTRKLIKGTTGTDWLDVAKLARAGVDSEVYADTGNDGIQGGVSSDWLHGGLGNDQLWGNAGDDKLYGEEGNDQLWGGDGNDSIDAGIGNDTAWGGLGNDLIQLGDGNDQGYGEADDDSLEGGAGNDSLWGGDGRDTLRGGADNDQLYGDVGDDSLDGGEGNNSLRGGVGNDSMAAGAGDDSLAGEDGDDTILAGAGHNTVQGGLGNDSIVAGVGNDNLAGDDGNDKILAGEGANTVLGGTGADSITAGAGNDSLVGGDGNDTILAGAGTNLVYGGLGADSIVAGAGADLVTGDDGDDTILGGDGANTVYGGLGADSIVAGTGADLVTGDDGADRISSGDGNDTLYAGEGNDTVLAGDGADSIFGDAGDDSIDAGTGDDAVSSGLGNDVLLGGAGADRLSGDAGDDTVDGGAGSDTVYAGEGNDIVVHARAANAGAADLAYGGAGTDTLRLDLTRAEWLSAAVQADVARYAAFLAGPTASWEGFAFKSTGLTAASFEKAFARVDGKDLTLADDLVTAKADAYSVSEDGTVGGNVLTNDLVPDMVAGVKVVTAPAKGTVTIGADGGFTYNPGSAFQYLGQGKTANATFTYRVTDADGDTGDATVTMTVVGANDKASITGTAVGAVTEDAALNKVTGKLAVADVDAGEMVFQAPAAAALKGTYGAFTFDATKGEWSYTLDNSLAATQALAAGQTTTETLTVKSIDGTASQDIKVTVTGTNDAPVVKSATTVGSITELADGAAGENTTVLTATGTIAYADVDAGDSHTIGTAFLSSTYAGGTALGSLVATKTASGTVTWTYQVNDAALDFMSAGQQITETYRVSITDTVGAVVTQDFTVTLNGSADGGATTGGGFMGKTVGEEYLFPSITTNHAGHQSAVVGNGVEFPGLYNAGHGWATIDLTANEIIVDFYGSASWTGASFNGFHLSDVDGTIANITDVHIGSSNMVGLTADRITFDADNIWVNWNGLSFNSDTLIKLDVTFAPTFHIDNKVALFTNTSFVDYTPGSVGSEAYNLKRFLQANSYDLTETTTTTSSGWTSVLADRSVLIIPELEREIYTGTTLASSLDAGAVSTISSWVADGHRLVVFGGSGQPNALLNKLFGFSTGHSYDSTFVSATKTSSAAHTSLASDVTSLYGNDGTGHIENLPAGSEVYYATSGDRATVAAMPYGQGEVVFVGWDWFDGKPFGSQDNGWVSVLNHVLKQTDPFV